MTNGIKVGDVVQLKSGGPKMTVTSLGQDGGVLSAWCSWFDAKHKECSGVFPVTSLTTTAIS
jgi:uncharacterized protein YodC (DUF2158 family)